MSAELLQQVTPLSPADVALLRAQFPALARQMHGEPAVFFDGPAGTQVPQQVIDAVAHYYRHCNANHGGLFATSQESDELLDEVHRAAADLLGAAEPECVTFGANMTSLTLSLSRSLARTWRPGDEVIVTRLEHDANFTPWVLAARDAGAIVRHVDIHPEDCTLNLENFHSLITERTKLVAVGCASNAVGTINPVKQICRWAKEVGALTFLDAVHFAPHALISVEDWGCDFLACSAYKFFGPHVGMLWGKRELLESLTPYKLRPAPGSLPGKWMTGTQNHECLAGTLGAIEYLTAIGRRGREIESTTRRAALSAAFAAITLYERGLFEKLLTGLQSIAGVKIFGITNPADFDRRLPTVSLTHPKFTSRELAQRLGQRGIFTWHGNFYALPLTESLGVEPDGMLRVGLVHYNTAEEVQRLIVALQCELA